MKPRIDAFTFFVTTKCTLRCKRCLMSFPHCPHPAHTPKEQVLMEIQKTAELCRKARGEEAALHADLIGGEPLLHPDILEIARELCKHSALFPELRIVTNSTIVPKDDLLSFMKSVNESGVKFSFLLDNYGEHSFKFGEILEKAAKWGIPCRIDNYTGEDQHFKGWVDIGDYPGHNRTYEEAYKHFNNGCVYKTFICLPVWNGKIYPCAYMYGGEIREAALIPPGEYLDLFDDGIPVEEKLRWIQLEWLDSNKPLSGCYHCNGFGMPNQVRYPAAEQLCPKK
jgi:hypothetical protein